jgi:hypothetical protein
MTISATLHLEPGMEAKATRLKGCHSIHVHDGYQCPIALIIRPDVPFERAEALAAAINAACVSVASPPVSQAAE